MRWIKRLRDWRVLIQLPRLLPEDAYPDKFSWWDKQVADYRMRRLSRFIPVVPGTYLDGLGDQWVLDKEGCWTDCEGVKMSPSYTPALAALIYKCGRFRRKVDLGENFFEDLCEDYFDFHYFPATYTAGRRKKTEDGFEAKPAVEFLALSKNKER